MNDQEGQQEWMTATEARQLLGIGRSKMTDWIKRGVLTSKPSRLDGRVTLVSRAQVEELLQSEPRPKSAPDLAA